MFTLWLLEIFPFGYLSFSYWFVKIICILWQSTFFLMLQIFFKALNGKWESRLLASNTCPRWYLVKMFALVIWAIESLFCRYSSKDASPSVWSKVLALGYIAFSGWQSLLFVFCLLTDDRIVGKQRPGLFQELCHFIYRRSHWLWH